jgi:hypothetical protein
MKLPVKATASSVISFFRKGLQPRWRLVETLPGPDGPVLNFRRGKAAVGINLAAAQGHEFEIYVDHASYGKLGR